MNYYLLKALNGVILFAFLLFCHNSGAFAAEITKTLDKDTKIMPLGFIVAVRSDIPTFKKGTVVTLNMYGEVLEGILAEDVNLPYETGTTQNSIKPTAMTYTTPMFVYVPSTDKMPTNRVLPFKGGTKVAFNDKGEAIKGTLTGSDHNIVLNPTNHIAVSRGEISFHNNGMLALCTLANNSYLRPVGWSQILTENFADDMACSGFVEFKAGESILLNDKGEVIKGTLKKDTKLRSTIVRADIVIAVVKVFEAGTTVEFDENGLVVKASK